MRRAPTNVHDKRAGTGDEYTSGQV